MMRRRRWGRSADGARRGRWVAAGHPWRSVPDTNWVALSQAALPPVKAGRFIVHGAHDRPRFAMRRSGIEIEAGEAFGTGHNATTVLCLEALDRLIRRRRFARVLDLGCGTGVLAIAAARAVPRARVLASDNDPVALAIARENARLNRVSARLETVLAAGFDHRKLRRARPYDLVLANLLPGPLIALAPAMRRAIRPGGVRRAVGAARSPGPRGRGRLPRVRLSSANAAHPKRMDRARGNAIAASCQFAPTAVRSDATAALQTLTVPAIRSSAKPRPCFRKS